MESDPHVRIVGFFVHSDWCRPVKTEADFTDESPTVDQFLRDSSELSSAIEERF